MLYRMALLACLLLLNSQLSYAAKCPLTYVQQFEYTCNRKGWVTDPQVLRTLKATVVKECATTCYSDTTCKSFKFEAEATRCTLYSKYLFAMKTEYDNNYQPGRLYERECYSTDCNVIKACQATKDKCDVFRGYNDNFQYMQYACSYGHTAKPEDHKSDVDMVDGSLTACQAIEKCIVYKSCLRTCDVHYHKPSKKWVCIDYFDRKHYPYYDYYIAPDEESQGVYRSRYGVRNSTVGAGYGFWIEETPFVPILVDNGDRDVNTNAYHYYNNATILTPVLTPIVSAA